MIISDKYKFVFVHIPKTGGSSITKILSSYVGKPADNSKFGWQIKYHNNNMHSYVGTFPKSYFSFVFIRNPWDWLVSIYKSGAGKLWRIKSDSFDDFIIKFCRLGITQSNWVYNRGNKVEYCARFENYKDEVNFILNKIGIPVPGDIPHELNRDDSRHYSEYYNDKSRELVKSAFRVDINEFGWEF